MLISVITLQIPELHQTHLHEDIESELTPWIDQSKVKELDISF